MDPDLESRVQTWADGDPAPETRAELLALLAAGQDSELADRMAPELDFGTAGLRAEVGAGAARMNRAAVIRASRALVEHLLASFPDAQAPLVVVGYDARLQSRGFAEDAAGVLAAAGCEVRYFTAPVPTPLVAYAQKELAGLAAVVVTASHNPPQYNGFKVFGPDAAQVRAPADADIVARMRALGPAVDIPRVPDALSQNGDRLAPVPDAIVERYLEELDGLRPRGAADRGFGIVYTALHGVGDRFVRAALVRAGFEQVVSVEEQATPDGRFPTIRVPNPEEPDAMALARARAAAVGADLVLANDPDADRLAVCVRARPGEWTALSGNQVGLLLADFVLEHAPSVPQPLVISTLVSSPMLGAIADARGARWEQTLTGFKWVWAAALTLERELGLRFVFGYEEALGYSVGHLVHDKDGISAAVLVAELVAHCRARGLGLLDRLNDLYRRYGLWVSVQRSVVLPGSEGLERIRVAMEQLRRVPPTQIAERPISTMRDFREGATERPLWRGAGNLIELELGAGQSARRAATADDTGQSARVATATATGGRVLVRPSGTEPKLKVYVDLPRAIRSGQDVSAAEQQAADEARAIADDLIRRLGLRS